MCKTKIAHKCPAHLNSFPGRSGRPQIKPAINNKSKRNDQGRDLKKKNSVEDPHQARNKQKRKKNTGKRIGSVTHKKKPKKIKPVSEEEGAGTQRTKQIKIQLSMVIATKQNSY